jgi:hypothetical protein
MNQQQQDPNLTYTSTDPSNERGSSTPPVLLKRQDMLDKSSPHTSIKQPAANTHSPCSTNSDVLESDSTGNKSEDNESSNDSVEKELELDEFIMTLLSKPSERMFLLKLEQDLAHFIRNHQ